MGTGINARYCFFVDLEHVDTMVSDLKLSRFDLFICFRTMGYICCFVVAGCTAHILLFCFGCDWHAVAMQGGFYVAVA